MGLSTMGVSTVEVSTVEVTPEDFEALVDRALSSIPDELFDLVENCIVVVEDRNEEEPDLLGLYEGIPITERDSMYSGVLPDRIFVYRLPTLEMCSTLDEVVDEVHVTVVHEIAHYFGIDDDRLHELGYE